MDFNKFSEAGRNIKLTEDKKREIVNACRNCETDRHKPVSPNFKRTVAAICALIIVLTAGVILTKHIGNGSQIPVGETETSTALAETTVLDIVHSEKSSETTKPEPSDIGGGDLGLLKYRMNYYTIPAPFAEIVESDLFDEWYTEVLTENPNETNVMVMKRFIQHFDVSREDFDKANLKWAIIIVEGWDGEPVLDPKDFANQEFDEVYNADVLYTLDDVIINDYYLSHDYPYWYSYDYKKAVENGEYITQTTNWVDIEQMEAEIIAKYGETEIVR